MRKLLETTIGTIALLSCLFTGMVMDSSIPAALMSSALFAASIGTLALMERHEESRPV